MKKRKGPGQRGPASRVRVEVQSWKIVVIDQTPLRRKAVTECRRQMAKLEKAKAEWKRFQNEDVAAYARWNATAFGPLLSRLRELESAVQAKEMLVMEVEAELFMGRGGNAHSAYARVLRRREQPPEKAGPRAETPPEWGEGDGEEDPFAREPRARFDDLPEFAQEMVFEETLIGIMGMNPDRMSDRQYEKMFKEFKEAMRQQDERANPPPTSASAAPQSTDARVKELYRLLVRRLHPDMRADGDAEVSAIWHEVQEAYRTGNVERLEMLVALSELEADSLGEQTSVAQMRAVLTELRRSYNALQRNLKEAKMDPAWNFAQRTDRAKLEKRMTSDLKVNISMYERRLQELEAQIAKWAAPPKNRRSDRSGRQMDFFG